jgi:hypothetical protein
MDSPGQRVDGAGFCTPVRYSFYAGGVDSTDVLIVTTESHRKLADEHFWPTLPTGANVLERKLDVAGDGAYESEAWQAGVTAKLHWAIDFIDTHPPGTVFVLCDVDIQFFPGFAFEAMRATLDRAGTEVLFQKESRSSESTEVNTGCYIARATPWIRDLLHEAAVLCAKSEVKNDQTAINQLLAPESLGARWGFLPFEYYARSQGFPPRGEIVLHHANYSGSVPEKSAALRRVRRYVSGGVFDKAAAMGSEAIDMARSGKLRYILKSKLRRQ